MSKTPRTATPEWKWRRREAIIRDDYTCQECGVQGGPKGGAQLEVHHNQPVAEGGGDHLDNLEVLCGDCHGSQHNNPEEDYLEAVREYEPAATSEVAEAVSVTRQGADYRLRQLEEDGLVRSKMAGNSLVWFVVDETDE